MSKKTKEFNPNQKVLVSASDLATLVAYRWDAIRNLDERGHNRVSDMVFEAGKRCSERLTKSGYWDV